jgi:hypothetical protein
MEDGKLQYGACDRKFQLYGVVGAEVCELCNYVDMPNTIEHIVATGNNG